MSPLTVADGELIGFVLQTVAYGISLPLSVASIVLLLRRSGRQAVDTDKHSRSRYILVWAAVVLTLLTTAHWIIDVDRIYTAFLLDIDKPGGAIASLGRLSDAKYVARSILFILEAIVLDSLLVYRVYLIWNKNISAVCAPLLSTLGTFAAGMGTVQKLTTIRPGEDIFLDSTGVWIAASFSLTLCTNVIALALVAYRILARERKMKWVIGAVTLRPIFQVLLEGAALFSICNMTTIITYELKSNVQSISVNLTSPIIAISFSLITIRVTSGSVKSAVFAPRPQRLGLGSSALQNRYPMEVRVTSEDAYSEDARRKSCSSLKFTPVTDTCCRDIRTSKAQVEV
ncbi:hypothetical protein PUNSTDRAFT_143443 [Punctularia strigosozonata HHB-11173 SS5]|uniref:uncharacterized protein n=1 Tax=Punctularia strigosozonata (strain HHB-11173) TaxID=741275 RepID=UPI0004418661|nr:uncharacterized protein PUNSTDRAFT_143443 [Punctularia strigosozonata HHB-11173 SS5]EIN08702.1 hypothetical protein PUNSTDRAFT_143443 [Punctularia strigosozonata HHB-11173 SS5]